MAHWRRIPRLLRQTIVDHWIADNLNRYRVALGQAVALLEKKDAIRRRARRRGKGPS